MKTKLLATAGAVVLSIVAAGECRAQARPLEVNVPFAFEVGYKTLPAGSYRVESIPTGAGSIEVLRSNNGDLRLQVLTTATLSTNGTTSSALIFHRYGNRNFLAQIRTGDGHAREVFPSKQEKELARSEHRIEIALVNQVSAGNQ
ncbi:MAG TPA: hypothetical protein VEX69_02010 [Candidatus Limnocylindria bacterium]|nr:hypothetical protein [Candidatus Limnocylindria bacterium]